MANEPLESIKFPGIANTFTVPAVDNTLAVQGAPADAKKVGDEITDIKADLDEMQNIVGKVTGEPQTYDLTSSDFTRKLGLKRSTDVAYPYTYIRNDVIGYQKYDILLKPNTTYEVTATVPSKYSSSAQLLLDLYDQSMMDAYNSQANINTSAHHTGNSWQGLTQRISSSKKNGAGETGIGLKFMVRQDSSGTSIADDFDVVSLHVEEVVEDAREGSVVRYDITQTKTENEKAKARENIGAASIDDISGITSMLYSDEALIIGDSETDALAYELSESDFTNGMKIMFGTEVSYPYIASNDSYKTYEELDMLINYGRTYKIEATVPQKYAGTAKMILVAYDQAYKNAHDAQAPTFNVNAHVKGNGWGGLTQTLQVINSNAGLPCTGLLISFMQAASPVTLSSDFVISDVKITELREEGE